MAVWLLAAGALLLLVFDSANFFPSPPWRQWAWWTSLACALLLGGAYIARYFRATARRHRLGLVVGAPILAFVVARLLLGSFLPHWYTTLAGDPVSFTATLRASSHPDGRSCRYRVHGKPFDAAFSDYFCAGREAHAKLPAEGIMRIRGRRSWFGLDAQQVLPGNSPP